MPYYVFYCKKLSFRKRLINPTYSHDGSVYVFYHTDISVLSLEQLSQENARLMALLAQQEQTIKHQQSSIVSLQHQLHLFRNARFGRTLPHIRDEVTEQLDVVAQMSFCVVKIRKLYACKGCEDTIKLAKLPQQAIPHSIATPGLIAAVINSKFRCHIPLYRQEVMFNEVGISVTR